MTEIKRQNLDVFDLIKGIATVLIVFHHYQQVMDCRFSGVNFFGGWFYFGVIVELFFVISGVFAEYTEKLQQMRGGGHSSSASTPYTQNTSVFSDGHDCLRRYVAAQHYICA